MSEEDKKAPIEMNFNDQGDKAAENKEAEEAGITGEGRTLTSEEQLIELQHEFFEFRGRTHQFVMDMNFRLTAIGDVFLGRGLVTEKELAEATEEAEKRYKAFIEEQMLKGQADAEEAAVDEECCVEISTEETQNKEECGGCTEGRKPPQCHGG